MSSQNPFGALKQDQAQVLFRDVVVGMDGFTQKVIHLRDAFDAGLYDNVTIPKGGRDE
jgi:hypothetical protein